MSNFSLFISSSWVSGRREGSRWLLREGSATEGKLCCSAGPSVKGSRKANGVWFGSVFIKE